MGNDIFRKTHITNNQSFKICNNVKIAFIFRYSQKDKPKQQKLASILVGLFAAVEGDDFSRRVDEVLPHIQEAIDNLMTLQKDPESQGWYIVPSPSAF